MAGRIPSRSASPAHGGITPRGAFATQAPGEAPAIIVVRRRRRRTHEAHHGGAWKVAYADFVTAMMAFFLLLWLLNVTNGDQRKGIADYFAPTAVAPQTSGSGGVLGGQTIAVPGALVSANGPEPPVPPASRPDTRPSDTTPSDTTPSEVTLDEALARREQQQFDQAAESLRRAIAGIPELAQLADSLVIDQTPEGLRIQIVDQANYSMFPLGSAQMYPQTRALLGLVAQAVTRLPNRLSISGHTDGTPYARGDLYSNWELSTDRANASRRALNAAGIAEGRFATVVGRADREHLVPEQPESPRNRRISIVLLREAVPRASPVPVRATR